MNERTPIVNASGDYEESILRLAKHLGTSKIRRRVFNVIYGRGSRARSRKQILDAAKIKDQRANAQQVQNELDHLAKHHLIVRVENDGRVKDGSRNLYLKDAFVRANKADIVAFADKKKDAKRVATKRNPIVRGGAAARTVTKAALRKRAHLTVLYLGANPSRRSPLRIDAEVRRVQEAVRASKFRDNITIEFRPAADLTSLVNGLNDCRPQVVHFSGHGSEAGVAGDTGEIVRPKAQHLGFPLLARALEATDHPPTVVVLNSCKSSAASKAVLGPARVVVAMRASITDLAAATFATQFYAAIASGQSVDSAFKQGCNAVEASSLSEADVPEMSCADGVDAKRIVLT